VRLRLTSGELALTIGLAAAVGLGPLLLRASPAETSRLEQNARRIQEMTEAERARLDRNFKMWQALPPAERQKWRDFVARLELDRQTNHGQLARTLEDYYRWLQSVPGYRREELRQTTDPARRTELVQEIVSDQVARRLDSPPADVRLFGRVVSIPTLSSEELVEVMAALEEALIANEQAQLVDRQGNELHGLDRYYKVISLLMRRYGRPLELLQNPRVRLRLWTALPPHVREELQAGLDLGQPELVARLMESLRLSIRMEAERAWQSIRPTPDRLRQFFENEEKLSREVQETLLELPADEFQAELTARYLRSELEGRVDIDFETLRRFLQPEEFRRLRDGERPLGERRLPFLLPGQLPRQPERFPPGPEADRPVDERRPPDRERREDEGIRPRPLPPGEVPPPRGDRPREGDRPPPERNNPF
jgi:hypothetical protein